MGQSQCGPARCNEDLCKPSVACFAAASGTEVAGGDVMNAVDSPLRAGALQNGGASGEDLGGPQEDEDRAAAVDELAAFFLASYLEGRTCQFPGYSQAQYLGVDALLHTGTGVMVWTHAVDLRGAGDSSEDVCREGAPSSGAAGSVGTGSRSSPPTGDICLFHYADAKTFVALADGVKGSPLPELADTLLGQTGPFGHGLHCCRKPPHLWESRAEILTNCRWPRLQEVEAAGGNARLASSDATNSALRGRLVEEHGEDACGFCVPVLCRRRDAMTFRGRRNRWGERQPAWLDAYVVHIEQDQRAEASKAAADVFVEVRRKRGELGSYVEESPGQEGPRPAG